MFYNSHIHLFTADDIPERFLPLYLVKILKNKIGFKIVTKLLSGLIPFTNKDALDRYVKFATIGKLGSQENIFLECKKYYPDDTKFIVLAMDMAFMDAGKVSRPYLEQLKELAALKIKYPQLLPFIHIDPRRKNSLNLLQWAVKCNGFVGVKMYPPLGIFPYDERFDSTYAFCERHNIPIITHCSPYNPVHNKGKKKNIIKLLEKSHTTVHTDGKSKKELCSNFTHPKNYIQVIKKYPKLKICFAHYGSAYYWERFIEDPALDKDNWFNVINDLLFKYENFYTDISFTMNNDKFFPLLKIVLEDEGINKKILFGSDYYMVQVKGTERDFGLELRAYLGEEKFNLISKDNVETFLGIS